MNNFSITTPLNLAPTGIASFAKSSICQDIREFEGDIAILGAPFDMSIQGRSGCRLGPRGIRMASTRFSYVPGGTYNAEKNCFFMDSNKWKVKDCGDVDYIPGDPKGTCENWKRRFEFLSEKVDYPVILGGDCSVVYPVVKGLEEKGLLDIIHFDAHLDWTKPMDGQKYFNGSPREMLQNSPM